eukprot:1058018-Pelagomonas_calceolata.AAC.6
MFNRFRQRCSSNAIAPVAHTPAAAKCPMSLTKRHNSCSDCAPAAVLLALALYQAFNHRGELPTSEVAGGDVEAWLVESQQQARLQPKGSPPPDLSKEMPGNLNKACAIW